MKISKSKFNIEILVGIFIFLGFMSLGIFTVMLSGNKILKSQHYYEVLFNGIGGLNEGDGVFVRGKQIGIVKKTILEEKSVRVYLTLDFPLTFYQDYRIEVEHASMLGGKILKIDVGTPESMLLDKDYVLLGEEPTNIMTDFHIAVYNLKIILEMIHNEEGTLGKLIFDQELHQKFAQFTEDLANIIEKIESGNGTIGKLLMNDELYYDTEKLVDGFNIVTKRVVDGEGPLGQLLNEDITVIEDLQNAVNELNIAMVKLNSTNGTLGKLLNDSELYDEGTKIIDDVRSSPLRYFIKD